MRRIRVIPTLLVERGNLVKTRRFREPVYVGDPINAVRIFNEKGADELTLLNISAATTRKPLHLDVLAEIASEAFMPLAYGGGITTLAQADAVLRTGVEKVVINSAAVDTPNLVSEAARQFGSQSVVVSIDVRRKLWGSYRVFIHGGRRGTGLSPVEHARRMEDLGAGELLITSIERDGTLSGYDVALLRSVTDATSVPVIASGGAGGVDDFAKAVREGGASAVAAGSMFVFQGRHRAVLISYPPQKVLKSHLFSRIE